LLDAALLHDATEGDRDEYGQRYILDFECVSDDLRATVRSSWIVREGENSPRADHFYVLSERDVLMAELNKLSVVALVEALPEKGLQRGQVGTIVESLAPGVYEVEFSDDDGRMYAFCSAHSRSPHAPLPRTQAPRRLTVQSFPKSQRPCKKLKPTHRD